MLVYWSGSGITKQLAERYGGAPLDAYVPEELCTLIFPTYGSPRTGGYVPPAVLEFLNMHSHSVEGVIGVGNTTFGPDFCKGAIMVGEALNVPVLATIDVVPDQNQVRILETVKEKYEQRHRT